MKKLLCLLLSLCLCLGGVSALAETVLKLGVYPEDVDTAAVDSHEKDYIPAFEAAMPDVTIERAHYKYAVDTFVPLAEAGSLPTVFETWFTEPQKLINGGFVADITDELTELGWLDKMNPSIRALLSDADGRVYGVPRDAYALGLMINVELFEDAGLVDENGIPLYPKTWEEFVEVGTKIKEATGSAAFVLLAGGNEGGWHFSNIAWTFGAQLQAQDADGKWIAQLDTPEALAAMQFVRDLKWEHDLLTSDPLSENWGTGFAQIGTGSAAMYIGANDAVAQPTNINGLPVDKLMMAGIPAGPAGAYSLSGGTPYMFAAGATHEEIMAALKYLEIMGRAPVLSETSKTGMVNDAIYRKENGIPVIRSFPVWDDQAFIDAQLEVLAAYQNVDPAMFAPYFDATTQPGNLHLEEPMLTQDMYGELTKVIQAAITDENADLAALLKTADENVQKLFDAQ